MRRVRNWPGWYWKRSRSSSGTSKTSEQVSAVSAMTAATRSTTDRDPCGTSTVVMASSRTCARPIRYRMAKLERVSVLSYVGIGLLDKLGFQPGDQHAHAEVVRILAAQVGHVFGGAGHRIGQRDIGQHRPVTRVHPAATEQEGMDGRIGGQHVAIAESRIEQDLHHRGDDVDLLAEHLLDQHIAAAGVLA